MAISDAAMSSPGIRPARDGRLTDMLEVTANITMGDEGGMIAPIVAEDALMAAAVSAR